MPPMRPVQCPYRRIETSVTLEKDGGALESVCKPYHFKIWRVLFPAYEIAQTCFRSLLTADSGKNRTRGRSGDKAAPFISDLLALPVQLSAAAQASQAVSARIRLSQRFERNVAKIFGGLFRKGRIARTSDISPGLIVIYGEDAR